MPLCSCPHSLASLPLATRHSKVVLTPHSKARTRGRLLGRRAPATAAIWGGARRARLRLHTPADLHTPTAAELSLQAPALQIPALQISAHGPQPCTIAAAAPANPQVLDAPGCAGDAVFFPAAYLRHRVRHLRTGTRRNLVWWAKGKVRRRI